MSRSSDTGCEISLESSPSCASLNYSSDINAIGVDTPEKSEHGFVPAANNGLKYLPRWPPVNLDFRDLTYEVSDVDKGKQTCTD